MESPRERIAHFTRIWDERDMSRRVVWPARIIIPLFALGTACAWMVSPWFGGITIVLLLALLIWLLLRVEKRWRREDRDALRARVA